jgi:RimJ/RimL family protein N-acetyltransferase
MSNQVCIETPRLLLRLPERGDFEPWAEMMTDPLTAQFIGGVQPAAMTWRSFLTMVGAWHIQGFGMFSVIEKATGQWIGRLGPWQPEGWPGTEVGWALIRSRWGHGLAREGAIAAIHWAFDELGWAEVIHTVAPDNLASQALARRLGARNRGPGQLPPPLEGARVDIWVQSSADFRAANPRNTIASSTEAVR